VNVDRPLVTSLSKPAAMAGACFVLATSLLVFATAIDVDTALAASQESADSSHVQPNDVASKEDTNEGVPAVPLLEKVALVVDPSGNPVSGATLVMQGFSIQGGASMSWTDGETHCDPPKITTNADGLARIQYPKYALATMRVVPQTLICRIEHPVGCKSSRLAMVLCPLREILLQKQQSLK